MCIFAEFSIWLVHEIHSETNMQISYYWVPNKRSSQIVNFAIFNFRIDKNKTYKA